MKNNNLLIIIVLSYNLFFKFSNTYLQPQLAKLKIEIEVSNEILELITKKKLLSIQEVKNLFNEIFKSLSNEKISITCQAVSPQGKYIGSFNNPAYKGQNIPGGQSSQCNIWLVDDSQIDNSSNIYKNYKNKGLDKKVKSQEIKKYKKNPSDLSITYSV